MGETPASSKEANPVAANRKVAHAARVKKNTVRTSRSNSWAMQGKSSLASISTVQLAAEIRRRKFELPKLERQASKLRLELANIEARIAQLGGTLGGALGGGHLRSVGRPARHARQERPARPAPTGTPRRRGGKPTLAEHIVALLATRDHTLSPRDIAQTLGKQFAREVNASFLVQISLTLRKLVNSGTIVQVGRAQYAAKESPIATS